MKKLIFALIAVTSATVVTAEAGTLTKNSVYCISQKSLVLFNKYSAQSALDLRKALIDKADCALKKKAEDVFLKSEVGDMIEVTLDDGFSVWINREDYKN